MPDSRVLLLFVIAFPLVCAASEGAAIIREFSTDGCSRFPDRSMISNHDWCHCCVVHDLAYWRGGSAKERLVADESLRECVERSTANPALADVMYAGVRAGGGPYFFTSYRWGYGWPFGRLYRELSPEERAAADAAQAAFLKHNPDPVCSGEVRSVSR